MTLCTYLLLDPEHFVKTYFCHELREGEFKSQNGGNWGPGVGQHAHVHVHIPIGRAWPCCCWWAQQLEWEQVGISYSVLPHAGTRQRLGSNSDSPASTEGNALLRCPKSCSGVRVCPLRMVHLFPPHTHLWSPDRFLLCPSLSGCNEQGGTSSQHPYLLFSSLPKPMWEAKTDLLSVACPLQGPVVWVGPLFALSHL